VKQLSFTCLFFSLLLAVTTLAFGFHDGGVANCSACHIMHNSEDGLPPPGSPTQGAPLMLRFSNATDVCLSCHADTYGAVWGASPLVPSQEYGAGNFVFLQEDNLNDAPGGAVEGLAGHHAGHNLYSPLMGTDADPLHVVAPGGSYPSVDLSCTSCHDPHGNGSFRMLYSAGESTANGFTYNWNAPLAQGIDLFVGSESPSNHTAYRSGMTNWCRNCHGLYHDDSGPGFEHPIDHSLSGDEADNYDQYNGDADPFGGSSATAYLVEVPFENEFMTTSYAGGPQSSSRISCISCHRAHATSSPDAGRWDFRVEFLDDDGVESGSWPIPNPFPNLTQRALCNKCHYDQAHSHGFGRACLECHRQLGEFRMPTSDPVFK
jgi:hypothetical protein